MNYNINLFFYCAKINEVENSINFFQYDFNQKTENKAWSYVSDIKSSFLSRLNIDRKTDTAIKR